MKKTKRRIVQHCPVLKHAAFNNAKEVRMRRWAIVGRVWRLHPTKGWRSEGVPWDGR